MVLLPALNPACFFSNYFFSLGSKPVQDDFQHDFARMTDEADSSVVLAELQDALFRECNNQRLSPWGRSPVLQIPLQISVKTSFMVSPPA